MAIRNTEFPGSLQTRKVSQGCNKELLQLPGKRAESLNKILDIGFTDG